MGHVFFAGVAVSVVIKKFQFVVKLGGRDPMS